MAMLVVDLSRWDGAVSIPKLQQAGVGAVIAKCGGGDQGLYRDAMWESNYAGCKSAGMPVGSYWYLHATTVAEAREEAAFCLKLLKGKSFEYPVYVDVDTVEQQHMSVHQPGTLAKVIRAFTDEIKAAGHLPGVYSWKWLLEPCGPTVAELEWWVCAWTKTKPCDCGLWQFGGETNELRSVYVAGYSPMDQSYAYKDYPAITKGNKGKEAKVALSVPEKIAQIAEHFAAHSAHGYSQTNRGTGSAETITLGDNTKVTVSNSDVDCSEMARQCANAAVSGSHKRPIEYMWTGNEDDELTSHGFTRIAFSASKVRRGDILWRKGHTGVALGGGKQAEAWMDENGDIYGPKKGDQSGSEVRTANLASWTYIYRYGGGSPEPTKSVAFSDYSMTLKVKSDCNVRSAPDVDGDNVTGTLSKGTTIVTNGIGIASDGRVWVRYLNYSGSQRYVSWATAHSWLGVA